MAHSTDEMKEQIVDAARDVFAKYGYKKTTLDDISAAVYKAKSSIYYYFRNKEEVFQAVIEKEAEELKQKVMKATLNEKTPEAQLKMYFWTLLQVINETTNYFRLLREEWFEVFAFTQATRDRNKNDTCLFLEGILRKGKEEGTFSLEDDELYEIAESLMLVFEGMINPWSDYKNLIDEKKFDRLMDIVLYGIT